MNSTPSDSKNDAAESLGRNEPCHCGSGKKYKRCHGVGAAPKLSMPAEKTVDTTGGMNPAAAMMGGMDPSQMDPEMMKQMQSMLQRLPRGQLIKLQSIMQRAMAGKDVSRESAEFERLLPPEFSQMARAMQAQNLMANGAGKSNAMDESDAKRIVAEAVASGKMSAEQAKELLGGEDPAKVLEDSKKGKGIGGFFKKLTGK